MISLATNLTKLLYGTKLQRLVRLADDIVLLLLLFISGNETKDSSKVPKTL